MASSVVPQKYYLHADTRCAVAGQELDGLAASARTDVLALLLLDPIGHGGWTNPDLHFDFEGEPSVAVVDNPEALVANTPKQGQVDVHACAGGVAT